MNAIAKLISDGKSVEAIARKTGLGRTSIYEHANGNRKISARAASAYKKAFNIPIEELIPDLFKRGTKNEKKERVRKN